MSSNNSGNNRSTHNSHQQQNVTNHISRNNTNFDGNFSLFSPFIFCSYEFKLN